MKPKDWIKIQLRCLEMSLVFEELPKFGQKVIKLFGNEFGIAEVNPKNWTKI